MCDVSQDARAPARLKVVGAFVGVVGALTILGALFDRTTRMTTAEVTGNVIGGAIATVIGVGLLLSQRWAWPLALALAAGAIGLGVYTMTLPGDVAAPAAFFITLVIVVLPGVLIAAALLSPRSFRWFRRRDRHTLGT